MLALKLEDTQLDKHERCAKTVPSPPESIYSITVNELHASWDHVFGSWITFPKIILLDAVVQEAQHIGN